jgi:hypothetical protein
MAGDQTVPSLDDPVVKYIAETEGVSSSVAQHRAVVQSLAPLLVPLLRAEFGSRFGGSFIDDHGQVIVSIVGRTSADDSAIANAAATVGIDADVTARSVSRSESVLTDLLSTVSAYMRSHYPAANWSGGPQLSSSQVVLAVKAAPDAAQIQNDLLTQFQEQGLSVQIKTGKSGRT